MLILISKEFLRLFLFIYWLFSFLFMFSISYKKKDSCSTYLLRLFSLNILSLDFFSNFFKVISSDRWPSSIEAGNDFITVLEQNEFSKINNWKEASLSLWFFPWSSYCLGFFEEPLECLIMSYCGSVLIFDLAVGNNFDQSVKKTSKRSNSLWDYIASISVPFFLTSLAESWVISSMIVHAFPSEVERGSPFSKVNDSNSAIVMVLRKIWMKVERS